MIKRLQRGSGARCALCSGSPGGAHRHLAVRHPPEAFFCKRLRLYCPCKAGSSNHARNLTRGQRGGWQGRSRHCDDGRHHACQPSLTRRCSCPPPRRSPRERRQRRSGTFGGVQIGHCLCPPVDRAASTRRRTRRAWTRQPRLGAASARRRPAASPASRRPRRNAT